MSSPNSDAAPAAKRSAWVRAGWWTLGALGAIAVALVLGLYLFLRTSLPQLSGELATVGIAQPVRITRDAAGVPTLTARTRADLAFATGFVHAQDRFFQMDLLRRVAAGELAELLGVAALNTDKQLRVHAFRVVAQQVVARMPGNERQILDAYVSGVNKALDNARARPWEYLALRTRPGVWLAEDSVLAAFSMYLSLNDSTGAEELAR